MLHPDDYEIIRPILERRWQGRPVSINSLLDNDDLTYLADVRQQDGGQALAPN